MDLEQLTPNFESLAHRILDRLQAGLRVSCADFPECAPQEFESLMAAIMAALNVRH